MCAAAQSGHACGAGVGQIETAVVAFEREEARIGDERAKGRTAAAGGAGRRRAPSERAEEHAARQREQDPSRHSGQYADAFDEVKCLWSDLSGLEA